MRRLTCCLLSLRNWWVKGDASRLRLWFLHTRLWSIIHDRREIVWLRKKSSASVHEINIETAEMKTTSLYDNPRGYYPLPTPPLGRRGARETFPVSQLRLPTHWSGQRGGLILILFHRDIGKTEALDLMSKPDEEEGVDPWLTTTAEVTG